MKNGRSKHRYQNQFILEDPQPSTRFSVCSYSLHELIRNVLDWLVLQSVVNSNYVFCKVKAKNANRNIQRTAFYNHSSLFITLWIQALPLTMYRFEDCNSRHIEISQIQYIAAGLFLERSVCSSSLTATLNLSVLRSFLQEDL